MRRVLALARKDLRAILRERTIILALFVQLFVAAFSGFLAFGLIGLYDPESLTSYPDSRVAYSGPGGFDAFLRTAGNLEIVRMDPVQAMEAFRAGEVDVVIQESYDGADAARGVTLILPQDEFKTTLLVTQLKQLLRDYERDLRTERQERIDQPLVYVDLPSRPSPFYAFAYGVLVPLLVLTPVFLSGAITGDAFTQEVNNKTMGLLRSTPITLAEIVAGKLLTPALLAPLQVLLWASLLRLNGLTITHLLPVLAFTFILALLLGVIGSLLALVVRREGHAQAAFALVVVLGFAASLLLPQDPLNIIARLAVGSTTAVTWITLAGFAAAAVFLLPLAPWLVARRVARAA